MACSKDRRLLERLFREAVDAVDPERAVSRALARPELRRALAGSRRVAIFAAGKAAAGMARAALKELGSVPALVVLPRGHSAQGLPRGSVARASHPEPDASSVRAARRALRFFGRFEKGDAVLCLVSGGTSSLVALPRPGLTLAAKRRAVRVLSRSGASILTLNRLRASLSAVKGGRLGLATRARLVTLVLSDVPGDLPAAVGSGPTVRRRIGDLVRVVGSNEAGVLAAAREARRRGLRVVLAERRLSGEAILAGRRLARRAKTLPRGTLLAAGGETTVTLARASGRGGRCLEIALAAAAELEAGDAVTILAAGSDGRDGSAGAAGAFADGKTVSRAQSLGLDARRALRLHDTRPLFAALGDLFASGPTGTNVGDWVFLLRR